MVLPLVDSELVQGLNDGDAADLGSARGIPTGAFNHLAYGSLHGTREKWMPRLW
jgi:hypothetical protein